MRADRSLRARALASVIFAVSISFHVVLNARSPRSSYLDPGSPRDPLDLSTYVALLLSRTHAILFVLLSRALATVMYRHPRHSGRPTHDFVPCPHRCTDHRDPECAGRQDRSSPTCSHAVERERSMTLDTPTVAILTIAILAILQMLGSVLVAVRLIRPVTVERVDVPPPSDPAEPPRPSHATPPHPPLRE